MGCGTSRVGEVHDPKKSIWSIQTNLVDKVADLKLSYSDLVGEKAGKIHNDYSLLNPPLGKGKSVTKY